jgi:hypothetical protein
MFIPCNILKSTAIFRCTSGQIIVAAVASPVDVVSGAGRVLVWSEEGIDAAVHLLDTCQAPEDTGVVDTPAGIEGEAADIRAGIEEVVDLIEAHTCSRYC